MRHNINDRVFPPELVIAKQLFSRSVSSRDVRFYERLLEAAYRVYNSVVNEAHAGCICEQCSTAREARAMRRGSVADVWRHNFRSLCGGYPDHGRRIELEMTPALIDEETLWTPWPEVVEF